MEPVPMLAGLDASDHVDAEVARLAARVWMSAGLVGLPTETVYGLAADACNVEAIARVYSTKGRPTGHPLIVHVAGIQALSHWASEVPLGARRLAEVFWPGPLTLVLVRSPRAGDHITGGQNTVALRSPAHQVALSCIQAFAELSGDVGAGIAAPSANRFGRVSPTSAADVMSELGEHLDVRRDLVIDGGQCGIGVESTIVDATGPSPRLLRIGAIGAQEIAAVWSGVHAPTGVVSEPEDVGAQPQGIRAPGMLESHYAPRAAVLAMGAAEFASKRPRSGAEESSSGLWPSRVALIAPDGVSTPRGWFRAGAPGCAQEYARCLYASLRTADESGVSLIVAVTPEGGDPLAEAVRDRLARASFAG